MLGRVWYEDIDLVRGVEEEVSRWVGDHIAGGRGIRVIIQLQVPDHHSTQHIQNAHHQMDFICRQEAEPFEACVLWKGCSLRLLTAVAGRIFKCATFSALLEMENK